MEAIAKQEARRKAKPEHFTNILDAPLVRDWKSNKHRYGFKVLSDRIIDGGRNHWAKNDRDKEILAILSK
jgi:hypothetical protein